MFASQKNIWVKRISFAIKIVIVFAAFGYIYKKVFQRTDHADIAGVLNSSLNYPNSYLIILILVFLMVLNWLVESYKWKYLVTPLEDISFKTSISAVLSGLTISIFTPNRVGEFGGRILHLENENRLEGTALSFIGSISQLLVTIILGALAILWDPLGSEYVRVTGTVKILILFFVMFATFLYIKIPIFFKFLIKAGWLRNLQEMFYYCAEIRVRTLLLVLTLSLFRYAIFSFQFILLLKLFSVEIGLLNSLLLISLTFLVSSAVPVIALAEAGVRGSAALAIIGQVSPNHVGIIAASFCLWILNVAVPAMAGSYFILQLKLFKDREND